MNIITNLMLILFNLRDRLYFHNVFQPQKTEFHEENEDDEEEFDDLGEGELVEVSRIYRQNFGRDVSCIYGI